MDCGAFCLFVVRATHLDAVRAQASVEINVLNLLKRLIHDSFDIKYASLQTQSLVS